MTFVVYGFLTYWLWFCCNVLFTFMSTRHFQKTNVFISLRLFGSRDCVRNHLAIFDAAYIDECVQVGDVHKVAVGNFFVPNTRLNEGKSNCRICTQRSHSPQLINNSVHTVNTEIHRPTVRFRRRLHLFNSTEKKKEGKSRGNLDQKIFKPQKQLFLNIFLLKMDSIWEKNVSHQ